MTFVWVLPLGGGGILLFVLVAIEREAVSFTHKMNLEHCGKKESRKGVFEDG